MKVEISIGDLIDKYTILKIKSERIVDNNKLILVHTELEVLQAFVDVLLRQYDHLQSHIDDLYNINVALWDIENSIREKERLKEFDDQFIKLARSVYLTNDRRAEVKLTINKHTNSNIIEVKQYSEYNI